MRKIREVLRLRYEFKMTAREVGSACGLGLATVLEYGYRAQAAGLNWPLPDGLSDEELEARLFPPRPKEPTDRPLPDWPQVQAELAKKGVTMHLVWQEYLRLNPNGYRYSRFVEMYRAWEGAHSYSMVQSHRPGEKLFVDFSGMTMSVTNPSSHEAHKTEIFVAAAGYSQYIFVKACKDQSLREWLDAHALAFEFFGGVFEVVVPDNLKSGVSKTCRYEPEKNPAYADLARHYGLVVLPARSKKPKDKAKVENAVLQVERWILAPLRHRKFFSIEELQEAMDTLRDELNKKPLTDLPLSRKELFEAEEQSKLRSLPSSRYQFAQWKQAKVGPDYHVRFASHAYSVPHRYCGKTVDVRITNFQVEIYLKGELLATHERGLGHRHVSTIPSHMPESHREYAEWTPERILRWASEFGPSTRELVESLLLAYVHPEHGFRPAMGIVSLSKRYGPERLEKACARALRSRATNYGSVKSILAKGLDSLEVAGSEEPVTVSHANIRGANYYSDAEVKN